ncbi:MAG: glycosyltransferase family 4 protein [Prevotella sp.]|nr:glycosyltransferase family 4 protein [Prevotella sp.]
MKILHIINNLQFGGAEKMLVDICEIMKEDHQVEILSLFGSPTALSQKAEEMGIPVHFMFTTRKAKYNPIIIIKLIKYLKTFEIIHVHLFPAQYWVALCKMFFVRNATLITDEHNTENTRTRYRLTTFIDHFIYKEYSGVICISKAVENMMRSRFKDLQQLYTIENGIQIRKYQHAVSIPREQLGIQQEDVMLLQVARFGKQKNQACMIRALTHLPQNYHAFFAGNGEMMPACKQLAEKLHVENRTHFLGSRADIPELWASADLGVLSSHWEGFGLSAVEGMASSTPVLVSNVNGLAQVVNDPELCFEEDNDRELANKMIKITTNPEFYQQKALEVQERAKKFDIRNTVAQYIKLYQKILSDKPNKVL